MYRDGVLPQDRQIAQQLQVRYDITVLLPVRLGREFNKTKGTITPNISQGWATRNSIKS
jgi:hypothetical protein